MSCTIKARPEALLEKQKRLQRQTVSQCHTKSIPFMLHSRSAMSTLGVCCVIGQNTDFSNTANDTVSNRLWIFQYDKQATVL